MLASVTRPSSRAVKTSSIPAMMATSRFEWANNWKSVCFQYSTSYKIKANEFGEILDNLRFKMDQLEMFNHHPCFSCTISPLFSPPRFQHQISISKMSPFSSNRFLISRHGWKWNNKVNQYKFNVEWKMTTAVDTIRIGL